VLGAVVDELPSDACERVLLVMRGAAKREFERLHRFERPTRARRRALRAPSVDPGAYDATLEGGDRGGPACCLHGQHPHSGFRRLRFVPPLLLHRVYIDEAGERGGSPRSSAYLVVSAVIVEDANDAIARSELAALRTALRRHPGQVLHFRKLSHAQKVRATKELAGSSIAKVTSVVVCKRTLRQAQDDGTIPYIAAGDPMYLWAVRLLLERVSWYIRDNGGGSSIVTFAHLRRFKIAKLHDYRARLVALGGATEIHWPSFDGHPFRVATPESVELLQLADIAASALFKAVEPDYGVIERRYLHEMRAVIYRRGGGVVTSYGLKVFPTKVAAAGGALHYLREH
jgi:hypothetical protein